MEAMSDIEIRKKYVVDKEILSEKPIQVKDSSDFERDTFLTRSNSSLLALDSNLNSAAATAASSQNNTPSNNCIGFPVKMLSQDDWPRMVPGWSGTGNSGSNIGAAGRLIPSFSVRKIRQLLMASRRNVAAGFHSNEPGCRISSNNCAGSIYSSSHCTAASSPRSQDNSIFASEKGTDGHLNSSNSQSGTGTCNSAIGTTYGSGNVRGAKSVHFDRNCYNLSSPYDESCSSVRLRDYSNSQFNSNILSSNSSVSSFGGGNRDRDRDKARTRGREVDDAARISLSRLFVSQGQFHLDALKEEIHLMEQLEQGVFLFNNSPEEGVFYMIEHKLIENDPLYIANFLLHTDFLDKKKVGELLGGHSNFSISILNNYVRLFNTNSLEPDIALRYFLSRFFLPGESQMVYRILERFSVSYVKDNQDSESNKLFPKCTSDHIHTLFYALVMLNTSLHNPHVRNKMSKSEFTSMCMLSGIPFGTDQLELMYDRVLENELKPFLSPYEQVYGRLSRDPKVLRSKEVPAVNVSLLQKGSIFRKFHSKRRSHTIIAWISQDSSLFCWKRVRRKNSDALLNPSLLVNNLNPKVDKFASKGKGCTGDACRCACSSPGRSLDTNLRCEPKTCIITNHSRMSRGFRRAIGLEISDLSCVPLEDIVDIHVGITGSENGMFYSTNNRRAAGTSPVNGVRSRDSDNVHIVNNSFNRSNAGFSGDPGSIFAPNKSHSGFLGSLTRKRTKRRSNFVFNSSLAPKGSRSRSYSFISPSPSHAGGARSRLSRTKKSELESRCFSFFTRKGERIDLCSLDSTHPSILIWVRFLHQTILKNQERWEERNDSSKRHTRSIGAVIHDNYYDQDKGIQSDLLKIWYHGIFLQWENHWSLNSHIISLPNSALPRRLSSMGYGGGNGTIFGSSVLHNSLENGYFSNQGGSLYIYSPKNSLRDEHFGKPSLAGGASTALGANDCPRPRGVQNNHDRTATERAYDKRPGGPSSCSRATWIRNNRSLREEDGETKKKLLILGLGKESARRKKRRPGPLRQIKNGILSQFYKKQNIFSKLTNYQAPISHPILHLWSSNVPYSYRGILWSIAVGNQLQINKNTFADLLNMRRRFLDSRKNASSPGSHSNSDSPRVHGCINANQCGTSAENGAPGTGDYFCMHAAVPGVGRGGPIREAFMVHLRRFHKDVSNVFPEFHSYFIGAGAVLGCKIWDRSNGFYSLDLGTRMDNKRESGESEQRFENQEAEKGDGVILVDNGVCGGGPVCEERDGHEENTDTLSLSGGRATTSELVYEASGKRDSLCDNGSLNESSTGSACFSSRQSPFSSPTLVSPTGGTGADGYQKQNSQRLLKASSNDNYCYYNYYKRDIDVKEVELESEVDSVFLFMNDNQETHKIFESTRILVECFMLYRPDIGYVEGMSHIAIIILLFNIDLLEAFKTFTNLLHSCYFLDLFLLNHRNVKMRLDFFDSLFKELIPSLYHHFDLLSITSDTYLMTWFTSLFSICLPIQIVPRVWDSIFLFGEPYAFQVAAAILKYHEHKLIMTSFEGCISILHTVPSRFDYRRFSSALEQFNGIIPNRFGLWLAAQRLSEQKADLFEELL
ncbi:protein with sec7+ TBC domains [Cryptosporidium ryanae]|uniref:protein with sec7+ TBC domains n=1 Tax=Cryptosporidium ryanae TaxID=515981 RepID=UPI00351A352B|nr:protein with sec7+ TBC domains [Cryptosporidium ryanae]